MILFSIVQGEKGINVNFIFLKCTHHRNFLPERDQTFKNHELEAKLILKAT